MTRTQALAKHLLAGKTVSIWTAYNLFGISNISRELIRLIEKPFNVKLMRTEKKGKTKYGTPCQWLEYKLTMNKLNAPGIKLMQKSLTQKKDAKKVPNMKAKV
jgi:hypothetical protein